MAKNDFTINAEVAKATATQSRRPRKSYTSEEAKAYKNERATQGRKGAKLTRINLGLTPEAHEYVKVMARVSGMNKSNFIEYCIRSHKLDHMEQFNQAIKIIDSI